MVNDQWSMVMHGKVALAVVKLVMILFAAVKLVGLQLVVVH